MNDSPAIRDDGVAVSDMCWFRLLTSQKMTLCCTILMMFVKRCERQHDAESIFGVEQCELGRVSLAEECQGVVWRQMSCVIHVLVINDTHCLI